MFRFVFVLAAILAVASAIFGGVPVQPVPICVENAEFLNCRSGCPLTCEQPNPVPCNKTCDIGCQCKQGFLRTSWGTCVAPRDCPNGVWVWNK